MKIAVAASPSRRVLEAAIMVGLAAIYGFNYVLIGVAVKELDPAVISVARALCGGLVLAIWRPRSVVGAWRLFRQAPAVSLFVSAAAVSLPLWLTGVAEHNGVSAGASAVVVALSPVLVAIAAPVIDHTERLGRAQWMGAFVAMIGVAIVVGSSASELGSALGLTAIGLATIAYAASSIVAKLKCEKWPPMEMALMTLTIGGLLLSPLAAGNLPTAIPALSVVGAMVLLSVLGTAMAFTFLYAAIKFGGAGFSLRPVYLSPAFSAIGGAILLDQPVTHGLAVGFVFACIGVALSTLPTRSAERKGLSGV